jgi:cell division protein ZapA
MTARNKVEVNIAGKEYTLVGIESDEYIRRIGAFVDEKMKEIQESNINLSTSMAAVLTSVNLADELIKSKGKNTKFNDELNQLKQKLDSLEKEKVKVSNDNAELISKNSNLLIELAKKEAELNELKSSLETLRK